MYTHMVVEDINMLVEVQLFQETLLQDVRLVASQQERPEDPESKKEYSLLKLINSQSKTGFMTQKRVHLYVSGKVQGVYFRQGMKETAEKNNVKGWVRNLSDKRVEAILEGEESNVDAVIDWSNFGPPGAIVEELKVVTEDNVEELADFEILS
jgi:acylphosphatase